MHMGPPCSDWEFRTIIQRWSKGPQKGAWEAPQPLVTKEISEKLGESKDKCEPIFMAIREYAINVRVIIP